MRPAIAPEVLAAIVAAVPSRAVKKLDASPRVADAWIWTTAEGHTTIATGTETVTLAGATDVSCTCLLSPRCFHVLAVLRVLPLGEAAPVDAPVLASAPVAVVSPAARTAAGAAAGVAAAVLASGIGRVSTLRLGELLRVAHACRLAALPRLESATIAVFEAARDLREHATSFELTDAAASLAELLLVADRIAHGDPTFIGAARRAYAPTHALVLAGVASAPVLRKGYAGVVTYFTDGTRVYSAADVLPGDLGRARDAYEAQLRFGEISLSHREATASGLLFARAEVSAEGRLGAGKSVVCAATPRDGSLVARLFAEPVHAQAERTDRLGLVFAEGVVVTNGDRSGLSIDGAGVIPLPIPIDDRRFDVRENLARLAGIRLRLVGRLTEQGGALEPLAGCLEGNETWFSFAYDRLATRDLGARVPQTWAPVPLPPVLDAVRRRVLRLALAGTATLPSAAWPAVAREATQLRSALLFTAADGLAALAASEARPARPWLGLHLVLASLETKLARHGWK